MSGEVYEQGYSSSINKVNECQISVLNLLYNKFDEQYILKLPKRTTNTNVKKEVKNSCKIIHFSFEWNFEEALMTICGLDPKEYPYLFIFVIDSKNLVNNQKDLSTKVANIQEMLLKFGSTRPVIFQITSVNENVNQISIQF